MNSQVKVKTENIPTEALVELIIDSIEEIKGKRIVKLDLRALDDAPTDYFIICEGDSTTQIKAIADNVEYRLKKEADTYPNHVEGMQSAVWICLDYFDVIVHVFHPEKRSFYQLEALWSDARFTEYESL